MHAFNREQFTGYARQQIAVADQMLIGHRPGPGRWCSCGKELPCSVAEHATAARQHMLDRLALLDATVVLPVLGPAAGDRPRRRRLFGGRR